MLPRQTIKPEGSTVAGPYSPALKVNDTLYLSGQVPMDGATGKLLEGDVAAQVAQCFRNLEALLSAAGLDFGHVVKTTVFLTDMGDFADMNRVYAEQFSEQFPARSTIAVAALPLGARVEIEAVAVAR